MTEKSFVWADGTGGDDGPYTDLDQGIINQVLSACFSPSGVAPQYLNVLNAGSGQNLVTISTGGALVNGKIYSNDAVINISIPSAGAGVLRIDRLVLRADYSNGIYMQTVRLTRLIGSEQVNPVAPSVDKSGGTAYDIKLWQALVTDAGAITLTDERELAQILNKSVGANAIKNVNIDPSAAIEIAKLLHGTNGQIVKTTNGITVWEDMSGALTWHRQGGNPDNWRLAGANNYVPSNPFIQFGVVRVTWPGGTNGIDSAISFPVQFAKVPVAFIIPIDFGPDDIQSKGATTAISETGVTFTVSSGRSAGGKPAAGQWCDMLWVAIGQ